MLSLAARNSGFHSNRRDYILPEGPHWSEAFAEPGPTLLCETSTTSATGGKAMIRVLNLFLSAGPGFSTHS